MTELWHSQLLAKAALPSLRSTAKPGDTQRSILPAEIILANT